MPTHWVVSSWHYQYARPVITWLSNIYLIMFTPWIVQYPKPGERLIASQCLDVHKINFRVLLKKIQSTKYASFNLWIRFDVLSPSHPSNFTWIRDRFLVTFLMSSSCQFVRARWTAYADFQGKRVKDYQNQGSSLVPASVWVINKPHSEGGGWRLVGLFDLCFENSDLEHPLHAYGCSLVSLASTLHFLEP